jgi:tetratricopeptide (TPR) repeat protein
LQAVDYYQRILNMDQNNGEVWAALGHCYLMLNELQSAYAGYQQALFFLQNRSVCPALVLSARKASQAVSPGPQAVVRHRHPVRSLRVV